MNRRYTEFRQRLRDHYRNTYRLSPLGAAQQHLCVGNAACSPVTAEPNVAYAVLQDMLADAVDNGRLTLLPRHIPISAERHEDRATAVTCRDLDHPDQRRTTRATFFLDGTKTGDTYPLFDLPYGLGSDPRWRTGEEHAPDEAIPNAVQSFTYCMVVKFVPGGDFTIPKPAHYETWRDSQAFKLGNLGATQSHPGKFFELIFNEHGHCLKEAGADITELRDLHAAAATRSGVALVIHQRGDGHFDGLRSRQDGVKGYVYIS